MPTDPHTLAELSWIALSILLSAMGKGGFPIGAIAMPLLILMWPGSHDPARTAVAFMLPVLCVMDVFAVAFYRRRILWRRILRLMPGTVAGVALGSLLFVSENNPFIAISDKVLQFLIGCLGIVFVLLRAFRRWIQRRLETAHEPGRKQAAAYGAGMGLTSTLAHGAGPLMQIYLLPQKLDKLEFAGTSAGYFFVLNLIKMIPFALLGRIQLTNLQLAVRMLPVIPLGVALGYLLVRRLKPHHYTAFIYAILAISSVTLIVKTLVD